MPRLFPTGNDSIDAGWTPVPSDKAAWEVVADRSDASYLSGTTASDTATFTFTYPGYATSSYGTNQGSRVMPGITSVSFQVRLARPSGAPRTLQIATEFGAVAGTDMTVSSSAFTLFTTTLTTDPGTNAAWTATSLNSRKFGLSLGGGLGSVRASSFLIVIAETYGVGNTRARLGPATGEPALFCAICSFPFHISDLIKVEDPRHPHVDKWVCKEDYDKIDPEPQGPLLSEGDLDFDL